MRSVAILRSAFIFLLAAACGGMASAKTAVVHGDGAPLPQRHAASELARDIARACGETVEVLAARAANDSRFFGANQVVFVGSAEALSKSSLAGPLDPAVQKNLSSEAFLLKKIGERTPGTPDLFLILGGGDRGVLYGVYDFSRRFLGVDPMEYWTGKRPAPCPRFVLPDADHEEPPPVFPLRGYFDNDDDMLANWSGKPLIVEFEVWKEMIDSLARLRYNYIDLHDTLGRYEFWSWPYYTSRWTYETDLALIDRIIDYAHAKGMLVQVPMYLGWQFHPLPKEKLCLSLHHDDWMDVYEHYLTKTPLGKADMFLQRPRDPWRDIGYRCPEEDAEGTPPGPLMTKMFDGLHALIQKHRPGAKLTCDLWAEGRAMWRAGNFDPDPRIDMMWADDGYARHSEWPEETKGRRFGVYIHAGYFLNHVLQDPYPERIAEASREAVRRGLTDNYFVNGQDFKHFILNLEAAGRAAWDPEGFDGAAFQREWTERYFGSGAAGDAAASLNALHAAHDAAGGFTRLMDDTADAVEALTVYRADRKDVRPLNEGLKHAEEAAAFAEKARTAVPDGALPVFDDQILFPARLYLENLKLSQAAAEVQNAFADRHDSTLPADKRKEAKARLERWKRALSPQLKIVLDLLEKGSGWDKWDGWTRPDHFRAITPPPDPERVERLTRTLK